MAQITKHTQKKSNKQNGTFRICQLTGSATKLQKKGLKKGNLYIKEQQEEDKEKREKSMATSSVGGAVDCGSKGLWFKSR